MNLLTKDKAMNGFRELLASGRGTREWQLSLKDTGTDRLLTFGELVFKLENPYARRLDVFWLKDCGVHRWSEFQLSLKEWMELAELFGSDPEADDEEMRPITSEQFESLL